jgi:hypothetical protein
VFIWVDKDFALVRGLHQGYPKKLGSIHQTRSHPMSQAAPILAAGGRFGATLAAADRRLAETVVRLVEPSETNGFVNGHPMAHHRWLPAIDGRGDAHAEIVESGAHSVSIGQTWRAEVEHLALFDSPTEELATLQPDEIIGGYHRQIGVVWAGGRVIHPSP